MTSATETLRAHSGLSARRDASKTYREQATAALARSSLLEEHRLSIFCAGSVARGEVGKRSDLDVFITSSDPALERRLIQYQIFAEVIRVNQELGLPEISNDGQYLKVYFLNELTSMTGSQHDDSDNLFTARMLLLLESEPLLHPELYKEHLTAVVNHYYRDHFGKKSFRPLFLLNDILRYWRTLCLNYEGKRNDKDAPWRKKNVNLKFSRMVTVFSTVLPLVLYRPQEPDGTITLCLRPPLQRLAEAVDHLREPVLLTDWPRFLDAYEQFLTWKEDDNVERRLEDGTHKAEVHERAEVVARFLHAALTHSSIPPELRRYLML